MIIIVEGGDATGKTSIAEWFSHTLGIDYIHFGKPEDMELVKAEYLAPLMADNVVLDRSFIGSRVWSELGYHAPTLSEKEWREMCRLYASRSASAVFMLRDLDAIQQTITERGEGDQAWIDAYLAQTTFMDIVREGELYYIPHGFMSPNLASSLRKKAPWNSAS